MSVRNMERNEGFSLVELVLVLAILGTLLAIAGSQFVSTVRRYGVERQIKEMHVDLMTARARAMQRNRMHFAAVTASSYATYEDTNTAPDGNGSLETASDRLVLQKTLKHPVTTTTANPVRFTTQGLVFLGDSGTIRATTSHDAEYDCIIVAETRTNMGKWNGTGCIAK